MKKKYLIIIIAVIIVVIVSILLIVLLNKNKKHEFVEIVEINYSYGGGFGTIVDTATKTLTFTPDGEVKMSNSYNSYTDTFTIDQSKYKELNEFISDRISLFDKKAKEDNDVMDGGSYRISIKLKNGETKSIGGYMIRNKEFIEIKEEILNIIDIEKLNKYTKTLRSMAE